MCEEAPEASLWIVGVLMSITASTCTNLGVNMQKYSFLREAKRPGSEKRGYFKQPFWAGGLFLVIFGSLGDFAALGFAPQTLVTPVGGFTMVANVVFAHFFLKEAFSKRDGVATCLIITGVIVVAMFADKAAKCFTLSELIGLYGQVSFIIYVILSSVTCTFLFYKVKQIESILQLRGPSSTLYKKVAKAHPVMYPALSGIFGAQSVLLAKSTAELFKITFAGENQFTQFGTYVIVAGMFVCIFLQIHWLAKGLQFFDAVFVVPVFQCFFISTSIVGGGVYFDEFSTMAFGKITMFFFGVLLTLFGVVILSMREMNKVPPIGRLRASVSSVIFIKRVQKIRGIPHKWKFQSPVKTLEDEDAEVHEHSQGATSASRFIGSLQDMQKILQEKNPNSSAAVVVPLVVSSLTTVTDAIGITSTSAAHHPATSSAVLPIDMASSTASSEEDEVQTPSSNFETLVTSNASSNPPTPKTQAKQPLLNEPSI